MEIVDILQIILGILSLISTIAVSFAIYWLQLRHEKEMERLTKENAEKVLKEEADRFLIDNESERDYLPLCVFVSNLHRHEKHTRNIYTNFCRCNKDLQNKILEVAEFKCRIIEGVEWVDNAIDNLKEDINKYKLGRDYLYDGAKYFHRGFERYRELKWDYTDKQLFESIVEDIKLLAFKGTSRISISKYVDDYFCCIDKCDFGREKLNQLPPIDYLWKSQNLEMAEESEVCGWMMEIIDAITTIIHNKTIEREGDLFYEDLTDRRIETFEDKYFETVRTLYYTYCI
ncbi:MAG TPA: hypothetical protein IAD46_04765 [Candidatus Pelethenecus faecipullorum]|uniref:Uncharacterized protein n=1 Tax=Candidatus Pelethenecus faecipullorum TaxID=2840900 RepID=A0A9D1GRY0_9MOLU|nr:hypothetical protein [Candidatus Pelethenecus faecipullorum]